MHSYYLLIFINFFFFFLVSSALECKVNPQSPFKAAYTIFVSPSGQGNFTTIGNAINSIPSGNDQWIAIYVNSGVYKEKIQILPDKTCIVLIGNSAKNTIITNNYHTTTEESITFDVLADNFIAKKITFQNSYNRGYGSSNQIIPAVAFRSMGDKHAFYKCSFEGYQDTLWDERGRHYFNHCHIEGAVDFIFGGGRSVYEPCKINATGAGFITAQNRGAATDPGGYVFNQCQVVGKGIVALGRAYGPFSRVIYKNSKFDDIITPLGWDIWEQRGHENDVIYAEDNCQGGGHGSSQRVKWKKKLTGSELGQYTTNAFINQDGWIDKLPCFTC